MTRQLYLNLPVKDLDKSKAFFTRLGFTFDPKFTDEKAGAMVIGKDAYVMLLTEPFFKTFSSKPLDVANSTNCIISVSCDSRAAVDELIETAATAGARPAMDAFDEGYMYSKSFYDLDGHHWEGVWFDEKAYEAYKKKA